MAKAFRDEPLEVGLREQVAKAAEKHGFSPGKAPIIGYRSIGILAQNAKTATVISVRHLPAGDCEKSALMNCFER